MWALRGLFLLAQKLTLRVKKNLFLCQSQKNPPKKWAIIHSKIYQFFSFNKAKTKKRVAKPLSRSQFSSF
ncbi:hypothetical protein EFK22_00150 [Lactococcus lactis subsp. lactis]|nr:hypothetical protein [Lactococcus lactis subsp. lactis]MCT3090969.1 hypothetical protein [Lactococcus lactis]MCT0050045.1 hypothetical protein [Lactococcus lactis subsp. lactis]MCT0058590.1 hypothetical protein [Lactococcus lactis subsp. lactis]MCT0085525.1 hypothetical protein [Lactococcus lactis subsp. lactis]